MSKCTTFFLEYILQRSNQKHKEMIKGTVWLKNKLIIFHSIEAIVYVQFRQLHYKHRVGKADCKKVHYRICILTLHGI